MSENNTISIIKQKVLPTKKGLNTNLARVSLLTVNGSWLLRDCGESAVTLCTLPVNTPPVMAPESPERE